jgi:hypothetical protein
VPYYFARPVGSPGRRTVFVYTGLANLQEAGKSNLCRDSGTSI